MDSDSDFKEKLEEFRILSGVEVDILQDGSLDYPDRLLERLDVVVAAIHSGFKHRCTERMRAAMENPHVDIIAHPTGRLISYREGYEIKYAWICWRHQSARAGYSGIWRFLQSLRSTREQ